MNVNKYENLLKAEGGFSFFNSTALDIQTMHELRLNATRIGIGLHSKDVNENPQEYFQELKLMYHHIKYMYMIMGGVVKNYLPQWLEKTDDPRYRPWILRFLNNNSFWRKARVFNKDTNKEEEMLKPISEWQYFQDKIDTIESHIANYEVGFRNNDRSFQNPQLTLFKLLEMVDSFFTDVYMLRQIKGLGIKEVDKPGQTDVEGVLDG